MRGTAVPRWQGGQVAWWPGGQDWVFLMTAVTKEIQVTRSHLAIWPFGDVGLTPQGGHCTPDDHGAEAVSAVSERVVWAYECGLMWPMWPAPALATS